MSDTEPSIDESRFIEAKAREQFGFVIDCFDQCRKEGNVLVNWFFAVIVGGLGSVGPLFVNGYWFLISVPVIPAVFATVSVRALIEALRTHSMRPPGNYAADLRKELNTLAEEDEGLAQLTLNEALGMDDRIRTNREALGELADAVDQARSKFSDLGKFFFWGVLVAVPLAACHYGFSWLAAN